MMARQVQGGLAGWGKSIAGSIDPASGENGRKLTANTRLGWRAA